MSVVVKISNYPPGIDEKDFAELLIKIMDAHGTTFRQGFLSCEIQYEESVALLEFEHHSNIIQERPWGKLANVNINGRTLKILSHSGVPSSHEHTIVLGRKSSLEVKESSDVVSSTGTSVVSNDNDNISSEPTVGNEVANKKMFEDMDVDEGVVSAEETSPVGTPPETTTDDNLLHLLSDVTTSTSSYFPTIDTPDIHTGEMVQPSAPSKGSQLTDPTSSCASGVGVNSSVSNATSSRTVVVVSSQATLVPPVPPQQSVVSSSLRNMMPVILPKPVPVSLPQAPVILPKLVPISNGSVTITSKRIEAKSMPTVNQAASLPSYDRPKRTQNQAASQQINGRRKTVSSPAVSQSTGGIPNKPLSSGKRVVFFDLETTGLDTTTCEIVQIAAACGEAHYNVYIKPVKGIPLDASKINGLSVFNNQLMKNGVAVPMTEHNEAWRGLINFLKGLGKVFLVGHNADWFDFPLMGRDIKKLGLFKELKAAVAGCIDSLPMFRSRLSNRRKMSFKQALLAQEYGISTSNAHDALADVQVLELLCKKVGITEDDYVKFRKPVTKFL